MSNVNETDTGIADSFKRAEDAERQRQAVILAQQKAAEELERHIDASKPTKTAGDQKITLDPVLAEAFATRLARGQQLVTAQNRLRQPNGTQPINHAVKPTVIVASADEYNIQPPRTPRVEIPHDRSQNPTVAQEKLAASLASAQAEQLDLANVNGHHLSEKAQEKIRIDRDKTESTLQNIRGTNSLVTPEQQEEVRKAIDAFEAAVVETVQADLAQAQQNNAVAHVAPQVRVETASQKAARETQEQLDRERTAQRIAASIKAQLIQRQKDAVKQEFNVQGAARTGNTNVVTASGIQGTVNITTQDSYNLLQTQLHQAGRNVNTTVVQNIVELRQEREARGLDPNTGSPNFGNPNDPRIGIDPGNGIDRPEFEDEQPKVNEAGVSAEVYAIDPETERPTTNHSQKDVLAAGVGGVSKPYRTGQAAAPVSVVERTPGVDSVHGHGGIGIDGHQFQPIHPDPNNQQ